MSLFNPNKAGNYTIEIIPFEAGEGNPHAEPGDYYFERTFYVHRVGPNNDVIICPTRTFKKPCPVCEHRAKLAADPDCDKEPLKGLIKNMLPKERQVFNIYDHAAPEKGVQLWDISFHNFGKHLDAKIQRADPELKKKLMCFSDPDKGRTIVAGGSEASTGKFKYMEFADIEFRVRKEVIEDALLDEAACLDECLIPLTYAEIKELFHQAPADEEDEPSEQPRRGRERREEPEPEAEDEPASRTRRRAPVDDELEPEPAPRRRRAPVDEPPDDAPAEGPQFKVGDTVQFDYKEESHNGDIVKIDKAKELYHVECDDREKPYIIGFADESLQAFKPAKKKATRQPPPDDEPEAEPAPRRGRRAAPVEEEPEPEPAPRGKRAAPPADDEWEEPAPPRRGGKKPAVEEDEPLEEEPEPEPAPRRGRR